MSQKSEEPFIPVDDLGASENPYRRTTDEAPRLVRVLAYLLWLSAAISAWNLLLRVVLGRDFMLDVGILLSAFAALGFLHARKGWRTFAVVISWFSVTVFAGAAVYIAYTLAIGDSAGRLRIFGMSTNEFCVFGSRAVRNAQVAAIAVFALGAALSLLFLWLLRRPAVREWFRQPSYLRVVLTRSAKRMLVLVAFLGVIPAGLGLLPHYLIPKPVDTAISGMSRESNGLRCAAYGYRFNRLAYVVFVEKPPGESLSSPVRKWDRAILQVPGGETIELPNATQLYEIVDEEIRTRPERVTREEFEAFLDSNPDRYTIEALLDFVGSRPKPLMPKSR